MVKESEWVKNINDIITWLKVEEFTYEDELDALKELQIEITNRFLELIKCNKNKVLKGDWRK